MNYTLGIRKMDIYNMDGEFTIILIKHARPMLNNLPLYNPSLAQIREITGFKVDIVWLPKKGLDT